MGGRVWGKVSSVKIEMDTDQDRSTEFRGVGAAEEDADSASRDTEKGGVPHGLYAIGDLHLSLTADKPMEVFGPAWENYTERIGDALSR